MIFCSQYDLVQEFKKIVLRELVSASLIYSEWEKLAAMFKICYTVVNLFRGVKPPLSAGILLEKYRKFPHHLLCSVILRLIFLCLVFCKEIYATTVEVFELFMAAEDLSRINSSSARAAGGWGGG